MIKRSLLAFAFFSATLPLVFVAVPSAQASSAFTADRYPVTVQASAEREVQTFDFEAGNFSCESRYHAEVEKASSTIAIVPTYENCIGFEFWVGNNVSIAHTGCSYLLHAGKELAKDEYEATADLQCGPGGAIKIKIITCEVEIKPQSGLKTVTLLNDTEASPAPQITIDPAIESMSYTVTADGVLCPFKSTGAKTDGKLTSHENLAFTGHDLLHPGARIGVDVGEGEGGEAPEPAYPFFYPGSFPATVHGTTEENREVFETAGGSVECETGLDGFIVETTSTLTLTPEYQECEAFGKPATMTNEGCVYQLKTGEKTGEDEYSASIDLDCEPGGRIAFAAENCKFEIQEQSGLGTVNLVSDTGASPPDVTLEMDLENVAYTVTTDHSSCPFAGTGKRLGGGWSSSNPMTVTAGFGGLQIYAE